MLQKLSSVPNWVAAMLFVFFAPRICETAEMSRFNGYYGMMRATLLKDDDLSAVAPVQDDSGRIVPKGEPFMLTQLEDGASFKTGGQVDPATVGTWQMMVPNVQGVATWIWEIRADGTYSFRSEGPGAVPSHRGTFTASGGKWSLQSTTIDWSDGGTYQMPSRDLFVVTGKLGTGLWQRGSSGSLGGGAYKVQTEQIGNQRIPKSLLSFVSSTMPKARAWRNDAVLTELRVTPSDSTRNNFSVQLHFYSPSDQIGLSIDSGVPFEYAVQEKGSVSWSALPIPPRFVDLPKAVLTAKQNGMTGLLRDALLIVHQPVKNAPILAWELMMVNGDHPYYVDAVSGQYLRGDVSGNLARMDEEWAEAAQNFRQYIQSLVPPQPSPGTPWPAEPDIYFFGKGLATDSYSCSLAGGSWNGDKNRCD